MLLIYVSLLLACLPASEALIEAQNITSGQQQQQQKQQQTKSHSLLARASNDGADDDGVELPTIGQARLPGRAPSAAITASLPDEAPIPFDDPAKLTGSTTGAASGRLRSNSNLRPRTSSAATNYNSLSQITGELLPFGEFAVQQPSFSDLMKSWPPTTQQAARSFEQSSSSRGSPTATYRRTGASWRDATNELATGDAYGRQMIGVNRNYLNEDFDDTISTADQSFESDQVADLPTHNDILTELGDFIYPKLKEFSARLFKLSGGRTPTGGSSSQTGSGSGSAASQSSGASGVKFEQIDEQLDDLFYNLYENSQVLYYGPQLVREGDIFEIGCYLPSEQPAQWTKSGRQLGELTSSPRAIRRSDFLGTKQNFSLKIFEASLVS